MYQSCLNTTDEMLLKLSICQDVNVTKDFYIDEHLLKIVPTSVIVLFGLVGVAGILGNTMVIIVVISNPAMRSTTNILILNLAIADLLFVVFCIPFTASDYIYEDWQFGNFWCKFVQYMIFVTCHASVYTLVFMSIDRFLAVVHAISSISIRTEENAVLAIIFAWFTILTSAFPIGITHGEVPFLHRGETHTGCFFLTEQGYSHIGFQISFFLSSYLIPLALISVLYIEMLTRLWRAAPGVKNSAESRRGKKRVTRLVVVVVLAFAVCWCPIQIVLLLKALKLYSWTRFSISFQILSHGLAYLNSCINPIFYAFLSENFLKAFKKFICCGSTVLITPSATITGTKSTRATGTTATGTSSHQEV